VAARADGQTKSPMGYGTIRWAAAIATLAAGCLGGGHNDVPPGDVKPELLCSEPDGAGGCPRCSSPVSDGACVDRWYATGLRCEQEGDGRCEPRGGRCVDGYCVMHDVDADGIDDEFEDEVARRNEPALILHPVEECGGPRAIVYHVSRHPDAPRRLSIAYVVLYDRDCGEVNGHLGDNEAFAITVDLDASPGAGATVGIVTDAHRHTVCESVNTCETAAGTGACAAPWAGEIVVWASRNKHANYFTVDECTDTCFDTCALGVVDGALPMLDVGTPDVPRTHDIAGFLSAEAGWHPELLHYDPWGPATFGDAGYVRDQLVSLVAPAGR
jgi:hypothetical protein